MDLLNLLVRSFDAARQVPLPHTVGPGALNRWRSRQWVESLAAHFREDANYAADGDIRVLTQTSAAYRREFGLNELLYDVLVCRIAQTSSAKHKASLVYVHDVLWQVESELANDSRAALVDFNKLVLGAANDKLFVGPQVRDIPSYLATLLPAAVRCTNSVHVALIPHPKNWATTTADVRVWRCDSDRWEPEAGANE